MFPCSPKALGGPHKGIFPKEMLSRFYVIYKQHTLNVIFHCTIQIPASRMKRFVFVVQGKVTRQFLKNMDDNTMQLLNLSLQTFLTALHGNETTNLSHILQTSKTDQQSISPLLEFFTSYLQYSNTETAVQKYFV